MSCGGWAVPTLRCPSSPEATWERRKRFSHPLGWLFSKGSGRTSAEPEVSGTGRLFPALVPRGKLAQVRERNERA